MMKSTVQKKHWLSTFLWSFLFCFIALPELQADAVDDWKGQWKEGKRAIMPEIPITAVENDVYLMIDKI